MLTWEEAPLGMQQQQRWHSAYFTMRWSFPNMAEAFDSLLGQNVTRQQAGKKDLKASQRQKDGRSFHCHSNVNVTSSASWLPHHSIQLLEATAIKLSAMRQFTPPM